MPATLGAVDRTRGARHRPPALSMVVIAVTLAPLPVALRPYPDETLRSWANRVGTWYGMSGTDLVNTLRSRAVPPEADGFSSL